MGPVVAVVAGVAVVKGGDQGRALDLGVRLPEALLNLFGRQRFVLDDQLVDQPAERTGFQFAHEQFGVSDAQRLLRPSADEFGSLL